MTAWPRAIRESAAALKAEGADNRPPALGSGHDAVDRNGFAFLSADLAIALADGDGFGVDLWWRSEGGRRDRRCRHLLHPADDRALGGLKARTWRHHHVDGRVWICSSRRMPRREWCAQPSPMAGHGRMGVDGDISSTVDSRRAATAAPATARSIASRSYGRFIICRAPCRPIWTNPSRLPEIFRPPSTRTGTPPHLEAACSGLVLSLKLPRSGSQTCSLNLVVIEWRVARRFARRR